MRTLRISSNIAPDASFSLLRRIAQMTDSLKAYVERASKMGEANTKEMLHPALR